MTANELADWIENGSPYGQYETAKQAVDMLRQQQAEIEALERRIDTQRETIARYQSVLGDVNSEIQKWKLKHD